jgi:hypothetical protein
MLIGNITKALQLYAIERSKIGHMLLKLRQLYAILGGMSRKLNLVLTVLALNLRESAPNCLQHYFG